MAASRALDFLVIGAQKSATSSLFEYLRSHPSLWLTPAKEAPFFSHQAEWEKGWDRYFDRRFAPAPVGARLGTVTPQYMGGAIWDDIGQNGVTNPEELIPRRIREQLPAVKLIALLRDPVERAVSHFRMDELNGTNPGPLDSTLIGGLAEEDLLRARRNPDGPSYIALGEYGRILAPYFRLFDRAQIYIAFTRDLADKPLIVLRSIFRFIGVDDSWVPPNLGSRYRVAASERIVRANLWSLQDRVARSHVARRTWKRLPPPARRGVDLAFDRLAREYDLRNRRSFAAKSDLGMSSEHALRNHFQFDRELLTSLIGSEPPWP